jgi:hypothetical protein
MIGCCSVMLLVDRLHVVVVVIMCCSLSLSLSLSLSSPRASSGTAAVRNASTGGSSVGVIKFGFKDDSPGLQVYVSLC